MEVYLGVWDSCRLEGFEDAAANYLDINASNSADFTTYQFLQWYVTEQREEETLARRILELFDIIGEEGIGMWTLDQEIGKLGGAHTGGEGEAAAE